jgi:hypothetical protein
VLEDFDGCEVDIETHPKLSRHSCAVFGWFRYLLVGIAGFFGIIVRASTIIVYVAVHPASEQYARSVQSGPPSLARRRIHRLDGRSNCQNGD